MKLTPKDCCKNCVFSNLEADEWYCFRSEPTVAPVFGINHEGVQEFRGTVTMRPKVGPNWWCGEYKKALLIERSVEPVEAA